MAATDRKAGGTKTLARRRAHRIQITPKTVESVSSHLARRATVAFSGIGLWDGNSIVALSVGRYSPRAAGRRRCWKGDSCVLLACEL